MLNQLNQTCKVLKPFLSVSAKNHELISVPLYTIAPVKFTSRQVQT